MTLQEQIRSNRIRTAILVLGFAALFVAIGMALSAAYDPGLMGVVGVVGIVYGLLSYIGSGSIVSAATGAAPADRSTHVKLYRAVENATIAAGLDHTPAIFIVTDRAPNAFAAGRSPKTSFVAATTGLLDVMDERELAGVMAHEIAHIRNRDVRLMTIATVFVGVIMLVTDMVMRLTLWGDDSDGGGDSNAVSAVIGLVALLVAPFAAMALQMALSRRREFLADAAAVEITGDAEGLARALYKLGKDRTPLRHSTRATAHMYIESPLRDQPTLRSSLAGMFSTHPPLQRRIDALCTMGGLDPAQYSLGLNDPEAEVGTSGA